MEGIDREVIRFLSVGDGDGHGNGYGEGYGYGNGYGEGYGNGYGDGEGYGYGDGDGDGEGYGYGDGYGYGNGDGDGHGDDYGDGYGDGYGEGYGEGYSYGDGYGDGIGYGIKIYNGMPVHIVDSFPTIITSVKGNSAKGFTLHAMQLTPCYIVKVGDYFAHGETLREALAAAQAKYDENKPLEERIDDFVKAYPTLDTIVDCKVLFEAHHTLTGSCEFGRRQFASAHNIDVENGCMTIAQFIQLTENEYYGNNIKQLKERYKIN